MAAYYEQQPLQQTGQPINIANAIRYFLGPESEWTTGQALAVDGSRLCSDERRSPRVLIRRAA